MDNIQNDGERLRGRSSEGGKYRITQGKWHVGYEAGRRSQVDSQSLYQARSNIRFVGLQNVQFIVKLVLFVVYCCI